jgi:transmembrane sensor
VTSKLSQSAAARAGQSVSARWEGGDIERSLSVTHARLSRRQQRQKLGVGALFLVALSVIGYLGVSRRLAGSPAQRDVVELGVRSDSDPVTRFADGSTGTLITPGNLVVRIATPTRIETLLESGSAEFEVTPNPERAFVVEAGPVLVHVVGTHFLVERRAERARVSVTRGKVRVTSGTSQALLEAGESRWFPAEADEAPDLVASTQAAPGPASSDDPVGDSTTNGAGNPDVAVVNTAPSTSAPSASRANAFSARERFVELAHQGDYPGAYKVLSQSPNAVGANAEELMLAADSARLSSHPTEALVYLRRVTQDFPNDARAALSAFTQGRILLSQLGRPAEAARAFQLARRLSPSGALAEDALARQAEALFRAGSADAAEQLFAEYEQRYPQGKHRATLSKLATEKR